MRRAPTWALEGSGVTEHPANLLSPPSDKWPQHELFISCLEKWTLAPPSPPPPPHVSKCDNSLICQGGSGGFGACVFWLSARDDSNWGMFFGAGGGATRGTSGSHSGCKGPVNATLHFLFLISLTFLCFCGPKPPLARFTVGRFQCEKEKELLYGKFHQ